MRLIIAIRAEVSDETEGKQIRSAVEIALKPFDEFGCNITSDVTQNIDPDIES